MPTLVLEKSYARDFALVLLASLVICLAGQISIPLWFTPVPMTLQNGTVLFLAALLGSRRAVAATFAFLAQGALGLPVFATVGSAFLLKPTGGYLIGYLVASFIVGSLIERKKSPILAFALGHLAIYACGAGYLATFIGVNQAILLGIVPFLLGDFMKMALSCKALQWLKSP